MKRNRKYNKNLVQENLMNGLRHIVFILIFGFISAQDCDDATACNFGQDGDCVFAEENYNCDGSPELFSFNQSSLQAFSVSI